MLEARKLCKSYHGRQVLEPASFFLPKGHCLGLCGGNGSGKSTLLRLIAQVEKPDSGELFYKGRPVLGDRAFVRSSLGYVPQEMGLDRELTVRQQLEIWQSACGLKGTLPEERFEWLGIRELFKCRISELSGGMQKRISIAMALMNDPEILIMDEASSGLDSGYSELLLSYAVEFLAKGGRVIWCSHDETELRRLCGNILRLQDGKIV